MALTLLELVDRTSGELGLSQPTIVIGSGVNQTKQLLALVQRVGLDLIREFEWRRLVTEYTFPTVASTGDYALPTGFDRMVADSQWDRTNIVPNVGSIGSQEWQAVKASLTTSTMPPYRYRLYANRLYLDPVPAGVSTIAYEYVSNFWVIATGGTAGTKASFTVDTDFCVFPDDLMLAGLKFYFLKAKKLDYGAEEADFYAIRSTRKAQDVPSQKLSLGMSYGGELYAPTIAEGNWNL